MEEPVNYSTRAGRMGAAVRLLRFGKCCEWCGSKINLAISANSLVGFGVVKRMFKTGNVKGGEPFRVLCHKCSGKLQGGEVYSIDYLGDYIFLNNEDGLKDVKRI